MDEEIKEEIERRLKQDLGEDITTKVMVHLTWALQAESCSCECACSGFYCNSLYPGGNQQRIIEEKLARGEAVWEESLQEGYEPPSSARTQGGCLRMVRRDEYGQLHLLLA